MPRTPATSALLILHTLCFLGTYTFVGAQPSSSVSPFGSSTVSLGYATYQGVPYYDPQSNRTNTQFLGIRFAAPPTGSLRWLAPQAPQTTEGVQVASSQPMRCLNAPGGSASTTPFRLNGTLHATTTRRHLGGLEKRDTNATAPGFSEDCLFLNVYLPGSLGSKKNLPVVVWIHGGGYVEGSATGLGGTDILNWNDLIRESGENVVVVVIQYRLGVFGFLPGQKVKAGGVLNAGLLDQQFALQWVQRHITKFGGDPQKVTIWGQSAGAGSVLQQVVANGGKTNPSLFRAAITSSTFLPSQYKFNDRIPEILYNETVLQTGCASAKDTLKCLRHVDVDTLQAANNNINANGFFGTFVFVPVVDGTFITERPTQLLKQKKLNGKVLYSVTNSHEGDLFVDQSTAATIQTADYLAQLFPNLDKEDISAGVAAYTGLGLSNSEVVNLIMSESIFVCPTYSLLRAFGANAFKGEFAIPPGTHGADAAYYFPSTPPPPFMIIPPFNNTAFRNAFSESFLNFAMSLNPNVKWDSTDIMPLLPPWTVWQGEMLFNKTSGGQPDVRVVKTDAGVLQRCGFWDSVSSITGQ